MTRHQPGVWEGCTTYLYVIPPEGFLLFTEGYLLLVDRSLFLLSRPKYQRSFDTIFSQLLLTLQSGYEKKNPPTRRSSFESNQDPAELAFGNRTKHSFKNNDLCIPPLSITCNLVTRTPEPRIITILKSSRADNIFAPNYVRGTDGIFNPSMLIQIGQLLQQLSHLLLLLVQWGKLDFTANTVLLEGDDSRNQASHRGLTQGCGLKIIPPSLTIRHFSRRNPRPDMRTCCISLSHLQNSEYYMLSFKKRCTNQKERIIEAFPYMAYQIFTMFLV